MRNAVQPCDTTDTGRASVIMMSKYTHWPQRSRTRSLLLDLAAAAPPAVAQAAAGLAFAEAAAPSAVPSRPKWGGEEPALQLLLLLNQGSHLRNNLLHSLRLYSIGFLA